jgi:hypothetical protein
MDIKQIYREETELDIYTTINLDDGWCFSNDYVKWLEKQLLIQRVSHQRELLKGDYRDSFMDWKNKYFEYKPKTYEYKSKNSKERYTLTDLHKRYERAMLESPFNCG